MLAVNTFFILLALFHLAYLGVMFGTQSEADSLQVTVSAVTISCQSYTTDLNHCITYLAKVLVSNFFLYAFPMLITECHTY